MVINREGTILCLLDCPHVAALTRGTAVRRADNYEAWIVRKSLQ
jgi:hypothetical protein